MKALESKSLVLLRHHLKALRLPTIGAECEKVARRAASDGSDHLTYLLQVTELELLERERKAAERRLKAARLPSLKSLESFDFAARPSVNKVLISELARCEFIDRRENVLLVGNPGTGKTHLAIGLAAAACARGYRVRFFRVTELVTLLIEARDERALLGLRARLAKLDLLVLDELGYVPASKVGAELLFDVISTAYERTSLMVTNQFALRVLDRGARFRAPDGGHPRSPHPPMPDHRDQGRVLPAERRQGPDPEAGGVGSAGSEGEGYSRPSGSHGRRTQNALASNPGAPVFDRPPLQVSTGFYKGETRPRRLGSAAEIGTLSAPGSGGIDPSAGQGPAEDDALDLRGAISSRQSLRRKPGRPMQQCPGEPV